MKPTLAEVKVQLRLELDFTEHDELLTRLVGAARRSIERSYYCRLAESQAELDELPEGQPAYLIDDDIQLAMQMMVAHWYLNPTGAGEGTPSDLGVSYLLFPLMEHTV
ncbi:TPA: head-tail connector protein [Citrobacter freundii]